MSKFKNYLLFVAILAVAGAIIGSRAKAWNEPEDSSLPVSIKLEEITRNPHALKGKRVEFVARFAARANMFREKDQTFTPENFENFSIWNSEVKFWDEDELKKTYPTLYISKTDKEMINRLRILNQYDKIEITGIVESMYANMPWIRVTAIRRLNDDDLDQPMASQITRAVRFINSDEFQKAKICFEIAQERTMPVYVTDFIKARQEEIKAIKRERILQTQRDQAQKLLTQARGLAKSKNFEQAATTYGKALKANAEYNSSPDIHKEIAGFFIDFYRARKDTELLNYSIYEFQIAQQLLDKPDSDILYALAFIETLKARLTHDYTKAEQLLKECLKINQHHYNGRKLLSEVMTCQLTSRKDKRLVTKTDEILLPVAPKKKITLRRSIAKAPDTAEEIEDIISDSELLALEDELKDLGKELDIDLAVAQTSKQIHSKTASSKVPGITSQELDEMFRDIESDVTQICIDTEITEEDSDTTLPDFPVSFSKSQLPRLAL